MHIKEGMIPTALGTAVTIGGLMSTKYLPKKVSWGIVGFGLAHIVLGGIDMFEDCCCDLDITEDFFD